MTGLKEIIERTEKIEPLGMMNGQPIISIEQQRDLALVNHMTGNETLDTVQFNPDGSVAKTPGGTLAVNPDVYFINRCKKVKDTLYVVTDYRAITEQGSGNVYLKSIPAYVIKRDDKGSLAVDKIATISDTEFISDFNLILDREAMAQIKPLLDAGIGVTKSGLPI